MLLLPSLHPSKVYKVPSDVWHDILLFCDVEGILMLEQTCHFFKRIVSDRHLWLKYLQSLDQLHAPDLPPYISINSLAYKELRDLVLRARRRVRNCIASALPLRIRKEITIPIGKSNANVLLGEPFGWAADTLLCPGGRYYFMKWPAGYLQCWDVGAGECLWTYPDLPQGDVPDIWHVPSICCFACDVQPDGDVHVALVTQTHGNDIRSLEVLGYSPSAKSLDILYQAEPVELDVFHGISGLARLCGDIAIVYTEGKVVVTFWKERRTVVITEGIFDALELVDEYIIGISAAYEGNTLLAIPLSCIRSTPDTHIKTQDIPLISCRITPPAHWLIGRAQLSICKFHWQEKSQRQDIAITVLGDVYNDGNCCDFPVAEFFSFGFDKSDLSLALNSRPTFTPLGRSQFTKFEAQFSTYSVMTPPSLAGATVLAFHDDRSHEPRFARVLATFGKPGSEVSVRELREEVVECKPATFSLNVEFYSGAVHYVTKDLGRVVIRYLD